jgi:hypothetical protein
LYTPAGVIFWKSYDMDLALTSIIASTALHTIGFYIASTDEFFGRSGKDIIDDLTVGTNAKYTPLETMQMSKWQRLFLVCTHRLERIAAGGVLSGAAYVVMWHMGIASINIPGRIKTSAGHIVAHAIISVLGNIGGYQMSFRLLSAYPSLETLRIVDSVCGGIVLPGLVYLALTGVTFEYDPSIDMPGEDTVITSSHLIAGTLIGAIVASFVVIMYVLSDLRSWLLCARTQLRQADRALLALTHNRSGTRAQQLSPRNRLAVSPSGKHYTTAVQRNTQAPPEVVQYTRQFLKTVTERSDTHPAVFTYRHRLYYDVDPEPCMYASTEPASLQLLEGEVEDEPQSSAAPFQTELAAVRLDAIQATNISGGEVRSTVDAEAGTVNVMVASSSAGSPGTGRGPLRLPALHHRPLAPVPDGYLKGLRYHAAGSADDM